MHSEIILLNTKGRTNKGSYSIIKYGKKYYLNSYIILLSNCLYHILHKKIITKPNIKYNI